MKLIKISLLTAVLCCVATQSAFADRKTDAQYWAETGFSIRDVVQTGLLSKENCSASPVKLQGCLAAVGVIAANASPALVLIPESLVDQPPYRGQRVALQLSPFALVAAPEPDPSQSLVAAYQANNEWLEKRNQILAHMIQDGTAKKIDFVAILQRLVPIGIADATQASLIASEVFGAYITTAEDAHAHIDPAAKINDTSENADEDFVGIGATLQLLHGQTVVQSVIKGSPAEAAGVKRSDVIVSVNGVPLAGMKIDAVVTLVRGPAGSDVRLKILRASSEMEIHAVRAAISRPNVVAELRTHFGANVGYIRLLSFVDNNACTSIAKAVRSLASQKAQSLILDLRDNGGGLVSQAVCIGGLFVGKKVIVIEKSLKGDASQSDTSDQTAITNLPLAVLINAGSASASEILAGALQDYRRAWIVGDRSFGKASVQAPSHYPGNDKIYYFHTIERFYQPTGHTNERVGILPDLPIPLKPDATADELFTLREAELYPIALSAAGPAWVQSRPKSVAKLQSCVGNVPVLKYQELTAQSEEADFQALSAEKALLCNIQ